MACQSLSGIYMSTAWHGWRVRLNSPPNPNLLGKLREWLSLKKAPGSGPGEEQLKERADAARAKAPQALLRREQLSPGAPMD